MSSSVGFLNGVLNSQIEMVGVHRIGINYDSGTFTIRGANGNDLSVYNPGYVTIPSQTNPGSLVTITLTSNFSFQDDSATSDITGNTFGTTSGISWSSALPMYLYFVLNDNEDDVTPMICRLPHLTQSPASASIGTPAAANANTQSSMWCLESITTTEWDANPALAVGSFQMIKNDAANDDWTVQTITETQGIGRWQEERLFTYPQSQNGAATGTHFFSNAGTEPLFDTQNYSYQILRSGYLYISITYFTCNTAGVGANDLSFTIPLTTRITNYQQNVNMYWMDASAGNARSILIASCVGTSNRIFMWQNGGTALVTNALFAAGDRISAEGLLNISN